MPDSDVFAALNELKPTNKDSKALLTALVGFLGNFQNKMETMFMDLRSEFLNSLEEKDKKINEVQSEVSVLKKHISKLEERIEDSEAYERRDAIIVSGSKVPAPSGETENSVQVFRNLTRQHLNLSIPENEISIAHRLGSSNSEKRSIIVKFCRRSMKSDVMATARRMKVQGLFINECLTPTQRKIGFVLRQAKKEFPTIVSGSTTFDGKHHVWVKSPNPNVRGARDSKQIISTYERLENFCLKTLKKPAGDFLVT